MLDFWATWCGPCVAAMPHNSDLAEKFAQNDLVILAICASDSRENYDGWVRRNAASHKFLTAHDPAGRDWKTSFANRDYHVTGFPTLCVIDRQGKIIGTTTGGGPGENPGVTRLLAQAGLPIDTAHLPPADAAAPETIPATQKTPAKAVPMKAIGMGGARAPAAPGFGALKTGATVRDFTVTGPDGAPITLSSFRGKPLLVHFFTTGRAPDAELARLYNDYHPQGLELLAIGVGVGDKDRRAQFDAIVAETKDTTPYTLAYSDGGLYGQEGPNNTIFGVGMFPSRAVIDAEGRLVGGFIGFGHGNNGRLQALLAQAGLKLTAPDRAAAAAVPPAPPSEPPPPPVKLIATGAPAPDFTTTRADGTEVRLSDHKGKVIVLDFWATWCGPCLQALPHTQEVAAAYKEQDVIVLASCTSDARERFDEWVRANQAKYPDLHFSHDPAGRKPERASRSLYGVSGIPTQFIIDREGRVAATVVGYMKGEALLEGALAKAGVRVPPRVLAKAKADQEARDARAKR
jgi:thiol-disulfide isomerase/thioredoxin